MNYAEIKQCDIANGPGVRVSLFVSGCNRHCKGCFNPETWDFSYGTLFTEETVQEILSLLKEDYISGLSILGGEPMEPSNALRLFMLAIHVPPEKSIWVYTGYRIEELTSPEQRSLLSLTNVLVDGPFEEDKSDPRLRFRGSSNQRIIDVPASRAANKIVLWEDPHEKGEASES